MPLDVDDANVTLELLEPPPAGAAAEPTPMDALAARDALKERLRPLVLEILDEELERHRRSQGR